MSGKFELKSLVSGILGGVLLTFMVGAANTEKSAESGNGRFHMLMNEKKIMILDSKTGKAWGISPENAPTASSSFWEEKLGKD